MRGEKLELALVGFTTGFFVLVAVLVVLLVGHLPFFQHGRAPVPSPRVRVVLAGDGGVSVQGAGVAPGALADAVRSALSAREGGVPLVVDVAPDAPAARMRQVFGALEAVASPGAPPPAVPRAGADAGVAPGAGASEAPSPVR